MTEQRVQSALDRNLAYAAQQALSVNFQDQNDGKNSQNARGGIAKTGQSHAVVGRNKKRAWDIQGMLMDKEKFESRQDHQKIYKSTLYESQVFKNYCQAMHGRGEFAGAGGAHSMRTLDQNYQQQSSSFFKQNQIKGVSSVMKAGTLAPNSMVREGL